MLQAQNYVNLAATLFWNARVPNQSSTSSMNTIEKREVSTTFLKKVYYPAPKSLPIKAALVMFLFQCFSQIVQICSLSFKIKILSILQVYVLLVQSTAFSLSLLRLKLKKFYMYITKATRKSSISQSVKIRQKV